MSNMKRYFEAQLEAIARSHQLAYELPTVTIGGQEYFVDDRLRQLRNVENPHDFIDF